jgi:hypothetical protein
MVKTKLKRGDTWRLVFTYTDAAGAPVDLSGASAHMQLRTAADGTVLLDWDTAGTELVIATNTVTLTVDPTDTADLTVGTYVSDLEITYPDGTVDSTDTFKIEVEADITVEVPAP